MRCLGLGLDPCMENDEQPETPEISEVQDLPLSFQISGGSEFQACIPQNFHVTFEELKAGEPEEKTDILFPLYFVGNSSVTHKDISNLQQGVFQMDFEWKTPKSYWKNASVFTYL